MRVSEGAKHKHFEGGGATRHHHLEKRPCLASHGACRGATLSLYPPPSLLPHLPGLESKSCVLYLSTCSELSICFLLLFFFFSFSVSTRLVCRPFSWSEFSRLVGQGRHAFRDLVQPFCRLRTPSRDHIQPRVMKVF